MLLGVDRWWWLYRGEKKEQDKMLREEVKREGRDQTSISRAFVFFIFFF